VTAGRAFRVGLFALACVLALATARELAAGRAADAAAAAALARSDWPQAIAEARAAGEAFVPGSPWTDRGLRTLAIIGRDAESRGDDATALLAYAALRTVTIETRSIWAPRLAWRQAADEGLVRVGATRRDPSAPGVSAETLRHALGAEAPLAEAWLAVLGLSCLALLLGLARLAFAPTDSPASRVARAAAVAGFVGSAVVMLVGARRG
jgi:hypothetical protein